ncbi:MAG: DUF559 domain-containing protein [Actinomycetota bacterium]
MTRYGVFSGSEAIRLGATRSLIHRRIAASRWERLHPGVFRIAGTPPSWRQDLLASILSGGPAAVASHRAGARLWHSPGTATANQEITVPRGSRPRLDCIVHQLDLDPVEFAYPDLQLAIEVDGYRWLSGKSTWQRDLHRRNELTRLGWHVIHVSANDIELRPNQTIETIRQALERRL